MRATCSLPGFALAALVALAGCGGEARDATSKELSALTAEISKLRAQQAAHDERLAALERGKRPAPPAETVDKPAEPTAAVPAGKPVADDRPALDVVRLGPSIDDAIAEDGDGDVDADGPRTVLRSGANGTIVSEQAGPGGTTRPGLADPAAKKSPKTPKKADKPDRPKTATLPTP